MQRLIAAIEQMKLHFKNNQRHNKHNNKPFKPTELPQKEDLGTEINEALKEPLQITLPIKFLVPKEIQKITKEDLKPRKSPKM
jgi:hypothetical protein